MSRVREEAILALVAGHNLPGIKVFDCEFSKHGMVVFLDSPRGRLTLYVRVPFQAPVTMAADLIAAKIQQEVLNG